MRGHRRWVRPVLAVAAVVAVLLLLFWREMLVSLLLVAGVGFMAYQLLVRDVLRTPEGEGDLLDRVAAMGDDGEGDEAEEEYAEDEEELPEEGGWWCRSLYLPESDGGSMPDAAAAEWVAGYHADREGYGAAPSYDPHRLHVLRDAAYTLAVTGRGLSPFACEYLGGDGRCRLDAGERPAACRGFLPPSEG